MNEKIVFGGIGALYGAGRRLYIESQRNGGLRRTWEVARKDLFVKTARDSAIGASGGVYLGYSLQKGQRETFNSTWHHFYGGIPKGIFNNLVSIDEMVDGVMFTPPVKGSKHGLNGQFFASPLSDSKVKEANRLYELKFTSPLASQLPLDQKLNWAARTFKNYQTVFMLRWKQLPPEIQEQLKKHFLETIPHPVERIYPKSSG